MIAIQFPPPDFRIQKRGKTPYIFDAIRKQWLPLTEEEWVRQNLVAYFINVLHYPKETIALEKGLLVNGLPKRFDILVYDKDHQPWMLVECKAPQVPLNEKVLRQALHYHLTLPARWIVISNGSSTLGWQKKDDQLHLAETLPAWGG